MTTMSVWEQELYEQLKYVELLGELNLQQTLIQPFGEIVSDIIYNQGVVQALQGIIKKYPTCLAVYLVTKGIYDYKEGNYWSSVAEALGMNVHHAQKYLGRFFEDFLRQHDLPLFAGVGGRRYVDIILLHGGIPYHSLDDYFAHILHPALSRPDLYGLQSKELILAWLDSGSQSNVDKPIAHFLQHGGNFAIDFVARSLLMGQYYAERGVVPLEEIGLPSHVVSAYQKWAKNQTHTKQSTKIRLTRPNITLDPWGGSLFIELPAQVLSPIVDTEQGQWRITGQEHLSLPLRAHWKNERWETESYEVELTQPAVVYHISLTTPDIKRTWHLQGLLPYLLIFDATNGIMLSLQDSLPAKTFWLLYHQDQELYVEGGKKHEEFPTLTGAWSEYRAEEWDLSTATIVRIGQTNIPIELDMSKLQPTLHGDETNGLLHYNGEPRIFVGSPLTYIFRFPHNVIHILKLCAGTLPFVKVAKHRLTLSHLRTYLMK